MKRRFFDWNSPFLFQAVTALMEEKTVDGRLDLSGIIAAFPSRRGLRRFEEILALEVEKRIAAEELSPDWRPPVTITVGKLPELVYKPKRPFANSLTEILAWRVALLSFRKKDPQSFSILFPFPPVEGDFRREAEIAGMLARLHRELASDGLDFTALLDAGLIPPEAARWRVLREIQKGYLDALDRLQLWDVQTARIFAVNNQECRTDKEIILIGAIDLNRLQKKILEQATDRLSAFIFAPEAMESFFDDNGCVIPDRWENFRIDIPDNQINPADDPVKEGELTVALAIQSVQNASCYGDTVDASNETGVDSSETDEIVGGRSPHTATVPLIDTDLVAVGVPDPETIPYVTEEFFTRGIPVHVGSGSPVRENRIFRLLATAAVYARTRSLTSFAEWIRHPDVERFFLRRAPEIATADWISALDRFQNRYVSDEVDFRWGRDTLREKTANEISPSEDSGAEDADEMTPPREESDSSALRTAYRLTEKLFTLFREDATTSNTETFDSETAGTANGGGAETGLHDGVRENGLSIHAGHDKSSPKETDAPESIGRILQNEEKVTRIASEKRRSLPEWPSILSRFLENLYPDSGIDSELDGKTEPASAELTEENRQIDEGLAALYSLFDEAAEVPPELAPDLFADWTMEFLLKMSAGKRIPPPRYAESVELIGWLDLVLDDHPNLVITGLNNGIVPSTLAGDLFLPNSLRRQLGIEDNGRRFARDAYFLSAILASRRTWLLFARRSIAGDPLLPSRLLLTGEPLEIAQRIDRFFGNGRKNCSGENVVTSIGKNPPVLSENVSKEPLSSRKRSAPVKNSDFRPPSLRMSGPPPTSMSVTEFADFLASPYRYFLRRHLRLERLNDRRMEFDAATFGNLTHDVLKEFGNDPLVRDSDDENVIAEDLHRRLDLKVRSVMARHPAGTVQIQIEQIHRRLAALARWQAAWRSLGNRIRYVEAYPATERPVIIKGDFGPMAIRGRIDRIDYHEKFRQWFIFDYKTFDRVEMGKNDHSPSLFPEAETFASLLNMRTDNLANKKHRRRSDGPTFSEEGEIESEWEPNGETSQTDGKTPKKKKPERWVDLQLPLYHKLAANILAQKGESFDGRPPVSGYIVLPKSSETSALAGNWTSGEIEEAFRTAQWVIRMIQRLWRTEIDPSAPIDPDHPEWGRILADQALPYADDLAPITGIL